MIEEEKRLDTNQDLILTLDLNEEIIQFNKESERLTGYTRDEILHKKFSEILLPQESIQQWKELFESIRQSMWIDNFALPLKIKNKQTYMIAWSGFLVKDESGAIKNICIFGKPLKSDRKPNQPTELTSDLPRGPPTHVSTSDPQKTITEPLSKLISHQSSERPLVLSMKPREPEKKSDSLKTSAALLFKEIPKQSGTVSPRKEDQFSDLEKKSVINEKIVPKNNEKTTEHTFHKSDAPSDHNQKLTQPQDSVSSPVKPVAEKHFTLNNKEPIKYHGANKMRFASKKTTEGKSVNKSVQEKYLKSFATMVSVLDTTSKKIDSLHETLQDLTQKYDLIADRITELEKKDRRWQKKHSKMNDSDSSLEKEIKHSVDQLKENKPLDSISDDRRQQENEQGGFFSNPFGLKRQERNLTSKQQQLETRSKQLETFEAQLLKERSIFNARVEQFSRWREKLMNLESAIEKRRQELMKREKMSVTQRIVDPQIKDKVQVGLEKHVGSQSSYSDDTLDKIPQSAAILQRGILKQINSPFEEMLGYDKEELVEKSFFDFVALEGLAEIEKYYLDRLKGDNVTMYTTVFSTKDNRKIPVEVSIKQTVYNGEKAEIVVITCVQKQNPQ